MLTNLRKILAAKWLAYRKRTEGYCEKHQAWESRFIGCEDCWLEHVQADKAAMEAAREARLQHKAKVYAKAMADETERRNGL